MPQVSIIVPVYKVEAYLDRCVESILAQTFTEFELILVDDGSPDNCPAMCDDWATKDDRIRVIHKENGGLSSARNAGMEIAVGDYILFCDSDDYVASEWCACLVNAIIATPSAFVVSDLWREAPSSKKCYLEHTAAFSLKNEISYFTLYKLGLSGFVVNKIYNLKKLREMHLSFDETCRYAEDVGFNVSYFSSCNEIILIETPLYYYCENASGITGTYYNSLFSMRLPQFSVRVPLILSTELPEYCDIWLYQFLELFKNIFDPRCTLSFWQKLRYNHKMMNTEEVRFCFAHASGKNENPLVMKILRTHNYYLFWAFEKLVHLKQKLGGYSK